MVSIHAILCVFTAVIPLGLENCGINVHMLVHHPFMSGVMGHCGLTRPFHLKDK